MLDEATATAATWQSHQPLQPLNIMRWLSRLQDR